MEKSPKKYKTDKGTKSGLYLGQVRKNKNLKKKGNDMVKSGNFSDSVVNFHAKKNYVTKADGMIFPKMHQNSEYCDNDDFNTDKDKSVIREVFPVEENASLVSVVVTIMKGDSYDMLYRKVRQKSPEGAVAVFQLKPEGFEVLEKWIEGKLTENLDENTKRVLERLICCINQVEPYSVLFNFECCSQLENFSDYSFYGNNFHEQTLVFIKFLKNRKFSLMFSDFSLRALITHWPESVLGPAPFEVLGECQDQLTLNFNPTQLKSCESPQLQIVGQLCSDGNAKVDSLIGTVVIGSSGVSACDSYSLEIMTVLGNLNNEFDKEKMFSVNDKTGTLGHAILSYKNGATIYVSSIHWIELKDLEFSEAALEEVSKNFLEDEYDKQIKSLKELNISSNKNDEIKKSIAKLYVQQSVPCKCSSKI